MKTPSLSAELKVFFNADLAKVDATIRRLDQELLNAQTLRKYLVTVLAKLEEPAKLSDIAGIPQTTTVEPISYKFTERRANMEPSEIVPTLLEGKGVSLYDDMLLILATYNTRWWTAQQLHGALLSWKKKLGKNYQKRIWATMNYIRTHNKNVVAKKNGRISQLKWKA